MFGDLPRRQRRRPRFYFDRKYAKFYARTLSRSQEELSATLSSGISVNHVVTVFYSLVGGWVFDRFGPGVLFATAAVMALCNSAFALTVPKPKAAG